MITRFSRFSTEELALLVAALEVVEPDTDEGQHLAGELEREARADLDAMQEAEAEERRGAWDSRRSDDR